MIARYRHPLFSRYQSMIQRCENPNNPSYKHYGARGVKVCEVWRKSFWAFVSAVGQPPTMQHTIERIDNDGDYTPGNVRWATRAEQNRNKRRVRAIDYKGQKYSVPEFAALLGKSQSAVRHRLYRNAPLTGRPSNWPKVGVDLNGEIVTIAEAAKRLGVSDACIHARAKIGKLVKVSLPTESLGQQAQ